MKSVIYNIIIILATSLLSISTVYAQGKLDTTYYNKNWAGTTNSHFAEYTFITYEPNDTTYSKEYQCYFRNGNIQSEGSYKSIDKRNALNNVYDINRTVYDKSGEICEYYEYLDGQLNGTSFYKNEDGSVCYIEYLNGCIANGFGVIEYPNGAILKFDPFNNTYIKDFPTKDCIYTVMHEGYEWQFYNMNGIIVGVCASRIKEYGKYIQLSIIVSNYTPNRFNFGVNNIYCTVKAYNKNNILTDSMQVAVLDKEQYLKKVKNRQIWNEIGAGVLIGLSSAVSDLSGAYNRTITTNIASNYGNANITTTYIDHNAQMQQNFLNASLLANQSIKHSYDLDRLSVGYLSENTIFPNSELSGHIMIPELFSYSGFSKPHWEIDLSIEVDGLTYNFNLPLGEFWANTCSNESNNGHH